GGGGGGRRPAGRSPGSGRRPGGGSTSGRGRGSSSRSRSSRRTAGRWRGRRSCTARGSPRAPPSASMSRRGELAAVPAGQRRESAREVALAILLRVERDAAYPDPLLDRLPARAGLDARDRALTTELVYGTLRWQRWLDWHLGRVSHRPIEALPGWLRALLRASAYQLPFRARVPARAAAHEAVELPKRRRPRGASLFVNAVLRALAGQPRPWPDPAPADHADRVEALALRTSQPTWLLRRWVARYGEA